MLEIPIENVNAMLQVRCIEALMTFPTPHAHFIVRIMRHKFPRSTSSQSALVPRSFLLYPYSARSIANCPFKYHQYRPPYHHSNLYPRRTRHYHPHPRGHICNTVSIHPTQSDKKKSIRISLVNLCTFWQLAICLQTSRFIRTVFEYDVSLLVLVVSEGEQDYVALINPDFLAELATNVGEAFLAVEAERFEAAVAEHLEDLGVFLTFLFKGQLTLLVVVFVLATTPIFTSLEDVLVSCTM